MKNDHLLLQRYLECYGSNIDSWPENAQAWIAHARKDAAMEAMIAQEARFESLLRTRRFDPARADLAQRIVRAARNAPAQKPVFLLGIGSLIPASVYSCFRPTAFATVVALGFALGFGTFHPSMHQGMASVQSYTDDEGAVL